MSVVIRNVHTHCQMIFRFERSKLQGLCGTPVKIGQGCDCLIAKSSDVVHFDSISLLRVLLGKSISETCTISGTKDV